MPQPKVLFVLTSWNKLGDTGKPTGWYLPEFAHPYDILEPYTDITVASPSGGEAPLDPSSIEAFKEDKQCTSFLNDKQALWKNTEKLSAFTGRAGEFSAIFFVGGHGPMFDLATDSTSQQIIREFYEGGKIVSAVCHAPAALVNVKLSNGSYLIADQAVTGFSNDEEDMVQLSKFMPFMLETSLGQNGGKYEKASEAWGSKVVVAGNGKLITGQNPASAGDIGKAVLEAINRL